MIDGNRGVVGNGGNVYSVTCRWPIRSKRSIPTSRPKSFRNQRFCGRTAHCPTGQISLNAASAMMQMPQAPPAWLTEFQPHPFLFNGHIQTIVGNFLPRPPLNFVTETETVE